MKLLITSLICTLSISVSFASGGAGHGSAFDLIPSFVNVIILAAALLYILVPKMRAHFLEKSKNVEVVMERASTKAREAKILMEKQNKKIENLQAEIESLKKEGADEVSIYRTNYTRSLEERVEKLKSDSAKKIETEKQELANNLNGELLDLVIANAKTKINSDRNLGSEATGRILEGLK